jgi:hypothetical protein
MGADILKIMQARRAITPVEDLIRAKFEEIVTALETEPYYDVEAPTGEVYRIRRSSGQKTREAVASLAAK